MDKSNFELFKQAISEGLSERFDSVVKNCTDEIVCSEKHKIAMRTIVYGKIDTKRSLSPKMRRIIAILVAAALLLTSCGIIFRNEIREIFEDVYDFFIAVTYTEKGSNGEIVEEVYELGYLPEGYSLSNKNIRPIGVRYEYKNENGDYIWFDQKMIDGTNFYVDSESGFARINNIENYEVYYRFADQKHVYVWNDGKYSFKLSSVNLITNEELVFLLEGLTIK